MEDEGYGVSDYDMSDDDREGDFMGDEQISRPELFKVLDEQQIGEKQAAIIKEVTGLLSVSTLEASLLLRKFNWCMQTLTEAWFSDELGVRRKTGVVNPSIGGINVSDCIVCKICFDDTSIDNIRYAMCMQHGFCEDCWVGYLENAISDGPGCLNVRCPQLKCGAAVEDEMIMSLVSSKFKYYLFKSYVESRRNIKWCPAPNCRHAIEIEDGTDAEVTCVCSAFFCWGCLEEPHRPVSCALVKKWTEKTTSKTENSLENSSWMVANTKPCPKCKRPIEKNLGCMKITCSPPCRFQFCWLCLQDWSKHGYEGCNAYKPEGNEDRRKARVEMKRYEHFYPRFDANEKSQRKSEEDLKELPSKLEWLTEKYGVDWPELQFIVEAWKEIIRCRRILKWTYIYGYYLLYENGNDGKVQLYNHLQEEAERALDWLHTKMEGENATENVESANFLAYKCEVASLTRTTRNFMDNLVESLENGLEEVDTAASKKNAWENSFKSIDDQRTTIVSRHANADLIYGLGQDEEEMLYAGQQGWRCQGCKFVNTMEAVACEVCLLPRAVK